MFYKGCHGMPMTYDCYIPYVYASFDETLKSHLGFGMNCKSICFIYLQ